MKQAGLLFGLLVLVQGAWAAGGGAISYSYVEADIINIDVDNLTDDTGFGLQASISLGDHIYMIANYSNADFDISELADTSFDLQQLELGLGYHHTLGDRLDALVEVSVVDSEIGNFNENGFNVSVGLRLNATEHIELGGKVGYQNIDEALDGAVGQFNFLYKVNDLFGINVLADVGDDVTTYGIGVRASF